MPEDFNAQLRSAARRGRVALAEPPTATRLHDALDEVEAAGASGDALRADRAQHGLDRVLGQVRAERPAGHIPNFDTGYRPGPPAEPNFSDQLRADRFGFI